MKDLHAFESLLSKLPDEVAAKIAGLADVQNCSIDEAIVLAIARGLSEIEKKLDLMEASGVLNDLSTRQQTVLRGLRRGHSVKELADELKVSEVTVRTHIMRIRQRLGCSDLLELRMPK